MSSQSTSIGSRVGTNAHTLNHCCQSIRRPACCCWKDH
jgi:hypothetical protein